MSATVALVNMPVYSIHRPSLALGLLKSHLANRHISAKVFYLNVDFAHVAGSSLYNSLERIPYELLAGDWAFSRSLWGDNASSDERFVELVSSTVGRPTAEIRSILFDIREVAERQLESWLTELPWGQFRIVGFSSVFQQNAASLALAARIKTRFPRTCIVFGGANCEGNMGKLLMDVFPFIDAVCVGEADECFPEFAEHEIEGKSSDILGMLTRASRGLSESTASRQLVQNLDSIPIPSYEDYFDEILRHSIVGHIEIPFETSRGCWWGERSHCTFCGLNGLGMAFRRKSPERVIEELRSLSSRWRSTTNAFIAVDNILSPQLIPDVFSATEELAIEIFFEVKANLTEDEIRQLSRGGVRMLQPGIESLSQEALSLMKKGSTPLQNVRVLKYCRQYGIRVLWNYLVGFPGETYSDVEEICRLIRLIPHLCPPESGDVSHLRYDRFSPYFNNPEKWNLVLEPHPSYAHVYRGLPPEAIQELAYCFQSNDDCDNGTSESVESLRCAISEWMTRHDQAHLFEIDLGESILICDARLSHAKLEITYVDSQFVAAYRACQAGCRKATLKTLADDEAVERWLEELKWKGLLWQTQGRLLTLAVPLGSGYQIPYDVREQVQAYLRG